MGKHQKKLALYLWRLSANFRNKRRAMRASNLFKFKRNRFWIDIWNNTILPDFYIWLVKIKNVNRFCNILISNTVLHQFNTPVPNNIYLYLYICYEVKCYACKVLKTERELFLTFQLLITIYLGDSNSTSLDFYKNFAE